MTLEQTRALPWYVHDSIIEGVTEEFSGDEGESVDLSTDEGLAAAGFTVREAE